MQLLWLDDSNKHFYLFRKLSVVRYCSQNIHLSVLLLVAFKNAVPSKYYRLSFLLSLQLAVMVLRAEVSCSKECCPFHRRKTNRGTRKIGFNIFPQN